MYHDPYNKNLRADLFYKIEITLMIANVRLIPRMSEKNPKCMAGQKVDGDIEILEVFPIQVTCQIREAV